MSHSSDLPNSDIDFKSTYDVLQTMLHVNDLTRFIIIDFLADYFDYFELPNQLARQIENKHCKTSYHLVSDEVLKETTLFDKLHSIGDNPAIDSKLHKIWYKCGFKHRFNNSAEIKHIGLYIAYSIYEKDILISTVLKTTIEHKLQMLRFYQGMSGVRYSK